MASILKKITSRLTPRVSKVASKASEVVTTATSPVSTKKSSTPKKVLKSSGVQKKSKKTTTAKAKTKSSAPKVAKKAVPQVTVPLVTAPQEKYFWLSTGATMANLHELAESFKAMDELSYNYHVTKEKNDFAQWVADVLDDMACAEALRRARTPRSARVVVLQHLKRYHW